MKSLFLLLAIFALAAEAGDSRLQHAIASCHTEVVKKLLNQGMDPNAKDFEGKSQLRWLASGSGCNDETALATAKLLSEHKADFREAIENTNPGLLSNLAFRKRPATLAYLCQFASEKTLTAALRSIARGSDLESVRALLSAGADPLAGPALSSPLFDAVSAARGEIVREMLTHVKDKQSPKVIAAFHFAKKENRAELLNIFRGSGIDPAEPVVSRPVCQRRELNREEARLLVSLGVGDSRECKLAQECGDLLLVDCNSAADGPAFYIDRKAPKLLATCGGACMRGCQGCPPPAWTCECKL